MRQANSALALRKIVTEEPADMAIGRTAREELQPVYDAKGFETETRRRVNVFLQFRETAAEDQRQDFGSLSAHAVTLMTIYAKAHGISGGKDLELTDYIDNPAIPNPDWQAYVRAASQADNAVYLQSILKSTGTVSASILASLCKDWFFGDPRAMERANGRREAPWRSVVRETCKAHGRRLSTSNEESLVVWEALINLKHGDWSFPERKRAA